MSDDEKAVKDMILKQTMKALLELGKEKYPERKEMYSAVICNLADAYQNIGGSYEQETE